jgi:hypothetical protein
LIRTFSLRESTCDIPSSPRSTGYDPGPPPSSFSTLLLTFPFPTQPPVPALNHTSTAAVLFIDVPTEALAFACFEETTLTPTTQAPRTHGAFGGRRSSRSAVDSGPPPFRDPAVALKSPRLQERSRGVLESNKAAPGVDGVDVNGAAPWQSRTARRSNARPPGGLCRNARRRWERYESKRCQKKTAECVRHPQLGGRSSLCLRRSAERRPPLMSPQRTVRTDSNASRCRSDRH